MGGKGGEPFLGVKEGKEGRGWPSPFDSIMQEKENGAEGTDLFGSQERKRRPFYRKKGGGTQQYY